MSTRFALCCLAAAACGDHAAAAPDAAPPDHAIGIVLDRGVAGVETLWFRAGDGTETQLSTGIGEPLCDGKTYCDFPPGVSATRFPLFDVAGGHAMYLDAKADATGNAIWSVDLATGAHTVISSGVAWAPLELRPAWAYAFARVGHDTYWSLVTSHGAELFRGDDAGSPLTSIAQRAIPAGQDVIQTWLTASDSAVAWSIETSTFARTDLLLDHAGTVRFSSDELPAGTTRCFPALLAGRTYAIGFAVDPHCADDTTWLFDTGTLAKRELTKPAPATPRVLSPDGNRLAELAIDPASGAETTWIFDTGTGSALGSAPGRPGEFSPASHDVVVTRGAGVAPQLEIFDVAAHDVQPRTGASFGDSPYPGQHDIFFTEDGTGVVTLVGDASPDQCANTGLRVLRRDGSELDLQPPTCDVAQLRLPANGETIGTLLYRDDAGNLVEADLATGAVQTVGANVRAFAVVRASHSEI